MEERGHEIFAPEEEEPGKDSKVFYNTEMTHNRDLSEIAGRIFREKINTDDFRTCDPLTGSGIRGFRYSSFSDRLFLNDANPEAIKSVKKGLKANEINAEVSNHDANVFLSDHRNLFHFIDVDPFGPFTPFLDSAARAANHQSFVGLTATDNSVTSGSYIKTCRRRYSSEPLRNSFMHEVGLRIYIKEVFENFARFDKCFDPKICFHERHYSRVMGRVTESKSRTNKVLENIGHLSFCRECRWRKLEKREECPECGSETEVAGPLWTGKFIDQRFTKEMLEEIPEEWEESHELLETLDSEAEILTPYYNIHDLSSNIGVSAPKTKPVIDDIRRKGYPVSDTHFSPLGFRTDAPLEDIKEIIQEKASN